MEPRGHRRAWKPPALPSTRGVTAVQVLGDEALGAPCADSVGADSQGEPAPALPQGEWGSPEKKGQPQAAVLQREASHTHLPPGPWANGQGSGQAEGGVCARPSAPPAASTF